MSSGGGSVAVERVGIVGGGIMGSGIAEVCARAGLAVTLVEADTPAAKRAQERIAQSLDRAVKRAKLESVAAEDALARLTFTDDLGALADRDFVIEAIIEDKPAKLALFAALDDVLESEDAILASNTSSMPIVELASVRTARAGHVLGAHFFNPVPVMSLVEIIPSLMTEPVVTARTRSFVTDQLGKDPIIAPDRAGFTVNALLVPYLLAAIRMFEQGLATAEDIDKGMVKGCAHPMGPLALSDLLGLDTILNIAEILYSEYREQLFAPPPLLQRLVAAGFLGRKSGHGFYRYD